MLLYVFFTFFRVFFCNVLSLSVEAPVGFRGHFMLCTQVVEIIDTLFQKLGTSVAHLPQIHFIRCI